MNFVYTPGRATLPAAENALDAAELAALAAWNFERSGCYALAAEQAARDGDEDLQLQARALAAWREFRGRVFDRQAERVERAEKVLDQLLDPDDA